MIEPIYGDSFKQLRPSILLHYQVPMSHGPLCAPTGDISQQPLAARGQIVRMLQGII